jgi:hypothetical protein
MGGTGLEPVNPSLSIRSGVRTPFPPVPKIGTVERVFLLRANEAELERTTNVAVVATANSIYFQRAVGNALKLSQRSRAIRQTGRGAETTARGRPGLQSNRSDKHNSSYLSCYLV